MRRAPPEDVTRWMRLRIFLTGAFFFGLLLVVLSRAAYLQVFQRDKLHMLAEVQSARELQIPAKRGDIYDRRGTPLAQSVGVDSIWIDPSELDDVHPAAKELSKALHLDAEELSGRMMRGRRFVWVKRQVTDKEVALVQSLRLPGVGLTKEPRRYYPQRELAAQVLGVVGTDGKGLEGLELAFNDELSGEPERLPGVRDAYGRKLLLQGGTESNGDEGAAVTLTLDRQIQYLAEKALTKAVEETKAQSGMVVVLDPKTGEVLALANAPRFNPNVPKNVPPTTLRNRAALDSFEPGSTFKSFLVAAALDAGAIQREQLFFCENGRFAIGRKVIHDERPHGFQTPEQILKVSSNIGAAKIAQALGRERLMESYARFGFGERTGLMLPGEAKGALPFPKAEIQLATQGFGQGLTATAVQLAAAYGALANGGTLMRPYLVSKVVDPDGVVLLENGPKPLRRVVGELVARQVVHMLESVVTPDGTAPRAHMDAYRVAGKTGTAQKVDPVARGYSDKRIASFAGMVPAEDPRLVIVVVIDEPKTDHFGGLVAAPAFKEIAEGAMPYLGVPPSLPRPGTPVPDGEAGSAGPVIAKKLPTPRPIQVKEAQPAQVVTERVEEGSVAVPALAGQVGRDAVARLLSVALEPRLLGSGRVVSQSPAAGAVVPRGTRVTLEMASKGTP